MLAAFLYLADLQSDLDAILAAPALKNATVGAVVRRADGVLLYERNSRLRLVPASNQKLLTAAFALKRLGPDFAPRTRIWKLPDRIVVDSPGDPMMTYAQLIEARRQLGQRENLPVYVRQAYRPGIGPSWEWDDLPNKYAAPVTAFTVDRGSFALWSSGGQLEFRPASYGARAMRFESRGPPQVRFDPTSMFAVVTGKLPDGSALLDTLALGAPDKAAGSLLGGPVLPAFEVPDTAPIVVLNGTPVGGIVKECLTRSDNNLAEHLLLMAAGSDGPLGDDPYVIARSRLRGFLVGDVGLDESEVSPSDGSGLSRHNFISASSIVRLLAWAQRQPSWPVWRAALPAAGSGTLTGRLAGSDFRGKTGTLDGASALSGYLRTTTGEELIVSLIFNNYPGTSAQARAIQDEFIRRLEKGTELAAWARNESDSADPKHRPADRHRAGRHDRDGLALRPR